MIKQIVFLKRRADMTMQEFMDYYENQHSQLSKRIGAKPPLPNAQRYVRRYLTPEKNPLTGEVIVVGRQCPPDIVGSDQLATTSTRSKKASGNGKALSSTMAVRHLGAGQGPGAA